MPKKFKTFILLVISIYGALKAQDKKSYEFIGALTTSSMDIISYKLIFTELEDGKITGESITDFYGEDMTTSKLEGTFNRKQKKISFTEIENISTKSKEDVNSFCYVAVEDLRIKKLRGKEIIFGKFTGKFKSGENCASGSIYLASQNLIEELKSEAEKQGIKLDSLGKIDSVLYSATLKNNEVKILKGGSNESIDWKSDKVVFDVWDGSKEDNDMINIYINGKLVKEKLIIKNKRITIEEPIISNGDVIKIVALNEGELPTNTVNFMFRDEKNTSPFISNLKQGEEFRIIINKN